MIIMMVLAMTVMFVIGAIAVDVGLWLSERRGAQTDADFVALSGAWELLDPGAGETEVAYAVDVALIRNDEQGNASLGGLEVNLDERCVSVDIGHASRPLFFAIFGVGAPEIGAHATACAGAASGPGNIVPFQIDETGPCYLAGEPKFDSMCPIELGAKGDNPRGMIDMEAPGDFCSFSPGDGDVEELIISSAPGICEPNVRPAFDCDPGIQGGWYDCVAMQTGDPKKVLDGVAARVAMDGDCDDEYGEDPEVNVLHPSPEDDFEETVKLVFDVPSGEDIYAPLDCDPDAQGTQASPRLVTLIVLKERPPENAGPTGFPILALAGFYIAGCANEDVVVEHEDSDGFDRNCTLPAGDTGGVGKVVVYGRFVKLILTDGGGGISDPTDQTTAFSIALVE